MLTAVKSDIHCQLRQDVAFTTSSMTSFQFMQPFKLDNLDK